MSHHDSPIRPWRQAPSRSVLKTPVFEVHVRHSSSVANPARAGEFYHLRCPNWVNVIALTPDRNIVMVEQFRHGIGQVTLEIPGGICEPGEAADRACERELREETGYEGEPARVIGRVSANPALQDNWASTGLVLNARPTRGTEPDELEEIAVRLVPLASIPELIRRGEIHNALVVAAFQHLAEAPI